MKYRHILLIIRPWTLIMILGILAVVIIYFAEQFSRVESSKIPPSLLLPLKGTIIVVDPGHGGIDGGTNDGRGILEKDIVFDIALELKDILIGQGANVILTREADTDLGHRNTLYRSRQRRDLKARIKVAEEIQAHMLVSIHVNYISDSNKKGSMIFFQKGSLKSESLADCIWNKLKESQLQNNEKPLPGRFFILKNCPVNSVLIEVGFISNSEEKARLTDPVYQGKLAEAINTGIVDFVRLHRKTTDKN